MAMHASKLDPRKVTADPLATPHPRKATADPLTTPHLGM